MGADFTKDLDKDLASQIMKNVSTGVALFDSKSFDLRWCNITFKKQTWFGGAGRTAERVNILDFFDKKDHKLIQDLFNITLSLGQAYDYQRQLRRGPVGAFPAEIKLHKIILPSKEILICMEILDLSITKMYDELQDTHAQVREKMADLMAAQAELHHSVRMNTISEVGSDIAHQLINPITMCRGILETQILPQLTSEQAQEDMSQALKYMNDIQNLAIWFRRFSDPKISEIQVTKISDLINDTLMLNVNRFTTEGVVAKIKKDEKYNPLVMINPINFIMWLNASFAELAANINKKEKLIEIEISGDEEQFKIHVESKLEAGKKDLVSIAALEKFAKKLPDSSKFVFTISEHKAYFGLSLPCFKEENFHDDHHEVEKVTTEIHITTKEKPLVLIVDDEQDIRRLIKRAMKQVGWDTVEAEDGAQALDYFTIEEKKSIAERVVVVVSDVRMPRMTGPHFLVALREQKIQVPFIFFSSNLVDKGDNGFKYDNVFYLTKEAGLEELKKLVGRYMPTSNPSK